MVFSKARNFKVAVHFRKESKGLMLPPDYFTNKEDRLLELYRQLEDFILKDITRRLLSAGEMTATADRLIWKLKQMGESQAAIEKKLQTLTGLPRKELRSLLQDAVLTSWEDDRATLGQLGIELSNPLENAAVIRVMDAEYKKSLGELTNLTRTTMKQSQIDLINMLDEADLRVAAGVKSYSSAVCDILDRYAGRGIYVDYPSGTRRTLEAAVRCCVVTSMNQTAAQVTNQYIVEAGAEYVLVSAHLGARVAQKGQPELASHADWQGKVYRIRGSEPGYPNLLDSTGYDMDPNTGQGTVKNPLGLHGYNCRHSHKPWDKRLRNPYVDENGNLKIDSEENRKRYELQQKQRYMERSIRATKRKLIEKEEQINYPREDMDVDKLQKEYDQIAFRMTQQNKAYNDFCKANDLQPQYDRIKVADFGKEQTKQANQGAKRYVNNKSDAVAITGNDDIINNNRNMANGMRKSPLNILDDKQIERINQYADELQIPRNVLSYNTGFQTGFSDRKKVINIRGDIFPDKTSYNNRDLLSERAVLAHEYYGHMKHDPSNFEVGDWRDEFRASYSAAINAPGLSDEERRMLMLDAYDRAKEAGISAKYNKKARKLIYGYDTE